MKMRGVWTYIVVALLGLALGIGVGILIAYFADISSQSSYNVSNQTAPRVFKEESFSEGDDTQSGPLQLKDKHNIIGKIIDRVDVNQMKQHVRFFSEEPHPAGSARDEVLAYHIHDLWVSYGLDDVQIHQYHILTPSPSDKANLVAIVDTNGAILFRSSWPTIREKHKKNKYAAPWHGFSPNATVQGDLVFVNYGTPDDYMILQERNVSVKGHIVIIKDGYAPAGQKVQLAESEGAIGVIIYPDPADSAQQGMTPSDVYPETWWLPADGIARSSLLVKLGDPLTPNYPSHEYVFRVGEDEAELPRIPSQPISYMDAQELLGRLGGVESPEQWKGALQVSYNIGPGFLEAFKRLKVRIAVHNERSIQPVHNVIGIIKGQTEPDRQVILGNHRDAWVYGAIDPVSGTAAMLEITRIFGQFLKEGWRPRRTLMFCSWGAEELGLIGSTEYVEDHVQELEESAVAYINVDTCVAGDTFTPMVSPMLKKVLFQVTQKVPDPDKPESTLFDAWMKKMDEHGLLDERGQIVTQGLSAVSDFAPFAFYAGIPAIDLSWQNIWGAGTVPFPVYHTEYELLEYTLKFLDANFEKHRGCARVGATMLHHLSESPILPYVFSEEAVGLKLESNIFIDNSNISFRFSQNNVSIGLLQEAIEDFSKAANEWQLFLDKEIIGRKWRQNNQRNISRGLFNRMTNDRMMLIPKAFFNRITDSHSWFHRYGYQNSISAILEIMEKHVYHGEKRENWINIQRHVSNLIIMINKSAQLLRNYKETFV